MRRFLEQAGTVSLALAAGVILTSCRTPTAVNYGPAISYVRIFWSGGTVSADTIHAGATMYLSAVAYYQAPAQCNEYGYYCDDQPPPVVVFTGFNWASSDPAIATVSGGVVHGVAPGTATVTATPVSYEHIRGGPQGQYGVTVVGP